MPRHTIASLAAGIALLGLAAPAVASPGTTFERNVAIAPVTSGTFNSQALWTDPNVRLPSDFTQYSGVGRLFTATDYSGFGGGCTGALIAPDVVLTAAHCVYNSQTNFVRLATWRTPDNVRTSPSHTLQTAIGYYIHPLYTDNIGDGYDIAFIKLGTVNPNSEVYEIYRGTNEFGSPHEKVGLGTLGTGATGWTGQNDGRKRIIRNVYDTTYGDASDAATLLDPRIGPFVNGTNADQILVYDYDSGLAENDVFGRYMGIGDTGLGLYESGAAPGDSGGPTFVTDTDGVKRIAGITSFGQTGSIFEVYDFDFDGDGIIGPDDWNIRCGQPTYVDVTCTRSSWGDISGDTRVSHYQSLIDDVLAGRIVFNVVPAPGALVLFGLGAAMLLGARRRQR